MHINHKYHDILHFIYEFCKFLTKKSLFNIERVMFKTEGEIRP